MRMDQMDQDNGGDTKPGKLTRVGLPLICPQGIERPVITGRAAGVSRSPYWAAAVLVAVGFLVCVTGCVGFFPHGSSYAIAIDLTDAVTGRSITGASIVARNEEHTISFIEALPGVYEGVQVPGTFTLTIEAEGYVSKVIDGVIAVQIRPAEFAGPILEVELSPATNM